MSAAAHSVKTASTPPSCNYSCAGLPHVLAYSRGAFESSATLPAWQGKHTPSQPDGATPVLIWCSGPQRGSSPWHCDVLRYPTLTMREGRNGAYYAKSRPFTHCRNRGTRYAFSTHFLPLHTRLSVLFANHTATPPLKLLLLPSSLRDF